ncbi:MAG: CDP-glycerol glycerophosphotransferase family protein [Thermodesulfobacteriota bacterium]|nr:CDP-glycerol glycerophosphotransferase family protein [Thermodesulfobacteriota bacterium]
MSARNFLRNPFYDYLASRFRTVIFSSMADDPEFNKEFKRENVVIKPSVFEIKKSLLNKLIFRIYRYGDRYYFYNGKSFHGVPLNLILKDKFNKRDELFNRIFGKIFILFPFLNRRAVDYVRKIYISPYYQNMIDEYKPSALFSSHPFVDGDVQLVINAKHRRIPTISMIHSWDNLTAKGRILEPADYITVWNEIMRSEMLYLYPQLKEESVLTVGIPQHDYLLNDDWLMERSAFLKSIGADPSKKVITYISRGGKYSNYKESENIRSIIETIQNGGFAEKAQLIIREIHGLTRLQYCHTLGPIPDVIYDVPDSSCFPSIRPDHRWKNDPSSLYHLGNLLKHSDVIINYASTITLDSVYFDKPIIWPIYEWTGLKGSEQDEFGRHELEYPCYQPMMATGAPDIASSPSNLVELIKNALKHPKEKSKQRNELQLKYNPFNDGKAGLRVAKLIESVADGKSAGLN